MLARSIGDGARQEVLVRPALRDLYGFDRDGAFQLTSLVELEKLAVERAGRIGTGPGGGTGVGAGYLPGPKVTTSGVALKGTFCPTPSWPMLLSPQQATDPPSSAAHVWAPAVETATAPGSAGGHRLSAPLIGPEGPASPAFRRLERRLEARADTAA
jgi:hypothetical protein